MAISVYLPFIVLLAFSCQIKGETQCIKLLKDLGYAPKYADAIESTELKVYFNDKLMPCGSIVLYAVAALSPPTLHFNVRSCCINVTVMAFAPETIVMSPSVTWLTINVPAQNLRTGFTTGLKNKNKNNGYQASSYVAPKYLAGEALNQTVVIFVYCQNRYIDDKKKYETPFRGPFPIKKYAKKYGLGYPIAAYFLKSSMTGMDLTNTTGGALSAVPSVVPAEVPSVVSSVVPEEVPSAVLSPLPVEVPETISGAIPVPLSR